MLRNKPGKPEKKTLNLVAHSKSLTVDTSTGSDADPRLAGATLRVSDDTYSLGANRWTLIGTASRPKGYKYSDPSGAIRAVVLRPKLLQIMGRGALLGHKLTSDPNPVDVALTTGAARYCLQFGGATTFKALKRYVAKGASAPTACP